MSIRETIFMLVGQFPDISDKECFGSLQKLNVKTSEEEVKKLLQEARFANSSMVCRFRDIAPDNHMYDIRAEKNGQIRLGIISDTHFGSKHHNRETLEKCVDMMLNDGVSHFVCPGDLIEGNGVYAGQASDISAITEEDQVAEAIKGLPMLPKGKKYYWISGNHDLVWLKRSTGFDPLIPFAQDRPDVEYLGKYSAYLCPSPNIVVQLVHPMSGGGASVSWQAQKFIDNLHPDRRADIILFGHWHSPMSMYYKGSRVEMCASFMGPSNLSIRNGWANVTGGKIIDITLDKEGKIQRYKTEDILFHEQSVGKLRRTKL